MLNQLAQRGQKKMQLYCNWIFYYREDLFLITPVVIMVENGSDVQQSDRIVSINRWIDT